MSTFPHPLADVVEPMAVYQRPENVAGVSIAISLKRIADALAPTEGLGYVDKLQEAISSGIGQGIDYGTGVWLHRNN